MISRRKKRQNQVEVGSVQKASRHTTTNSVKPLSLPHEQAEQEPVPIALLGDPVLRLVAKAVVDVREPAFLEQKTLLMRALREFRALHGFGRAISAPQISVSLRFIAVNLSGKESFLINPVITWKSRATFTMWDDCMSFPSLMVRVRRHNSISLNYTDEEGQPQSLLKLDQATSELLQHEMDHLDGVLSVDLALDKDAIVDRRQFEAQPAYFRKMVDYTIS